MKQRRTYYRVQRSEHNGVVNRAFGGRVVSWTPWKTVAAYLNQADAESAFEVWSGKGLTRWRVVYLGKVIRKSL